MTQPVPVPDVISDDQLHQMPETCRCSRVLGRSGGWRLINTNGCPHHIRSER